MSDTDLSTANSAPNDKLRATVGQHNYAKMPMEHHQALQAMRHKFGAANISVDSGSAFQNADEFHKNRYRANTQAIVHQSDAFGSGVVGRLSHPDTGRASSSSSSSGAAMGEFAIDTHTISDHEQHRLIANGTTKSFKDVLQKAHSAELEQKLRASAYWQHFLTNHGGDFDSCRLDGPRYASTNGSPWSMFLYEWSALYVKELMATFLLVFCVSLMTTLLHESADTSYGPLPAALVLAVSSFVLSIFFPGVHMNPNITLYMLSRSCMSVTSPRQQKNASKQSLLQSTKFADKEESWRIALCVVMRLVQIGIQLVGSMLAPIVVYQMDYVHHLQRVALQAPDAHTDSAAYYLNLGQTVPNQSLETGEWNAYGLEFLGTFMVIMMLRYTLIESTKASMDAMSVNSPSTLRQRIHGDANAAWNHIYGNGHVPIVLALGVLLFGNITGASMNWARSFGPAWYVNDRWSANDGMYAKSSNEFDGFHYLLGYALAQTAAVLVVVVADWCMYMLEQRYVCSSLKLSLPVMIGLRDQYFTEDRRAPDDARLMSELELEKGGRQE